MTYDLAFYQQETDIALTSARIVLPDILADTAATSVIDIGCGTGAWAHVAELAGCDVKGVDLAVPRDLLLIRAYTDHDLARGYDCTGWDLAICLEVAEHLPAEAAELLVAGLVGANNVLFSAATPGQPGVGHINCQPHEYWHDLFARYGHTYEWVGPRYREPVADFYIRNMFLYARTP